MRAPAATPRGLAARQVLDAPALDARAVLARAADPRRARTQAGAAFVRGSTASTAAAPLAVLPSDAAAGAAAAGAAASSDWALVTPDGAVDRVVTNRGPLVAALGLEPRDLRLLDPRLADSYPSALLTRGAAVVVRLDTVKAVVTPDWALVADAGRGSVAAFVDALSAALRGNAPSPTTTAPATSKRRLGVTRLLSRGASRPPGLPTVPATAPSLTPRGGFGGATADDDDASLFHLPDDAPFELRFLEAALDWTASAFHVAVNAIEAAARPCLRTPAASKLTTDFLKRLRALKSRIVVTRVKLENVKEVLERLLDDDGDMEALVVSAAAAAAAAGGPGKRPGATLRALAAVTPAARAHAAAAMGQAAGHAAVGAHTGGHAAAAHAGGHPPTDRHTHQKHAPTSKKRAPLFRRLAGARRSYAGGRPPPATTAALAAALDRTSVGPGGASPSPAAAAAVAKALAARLERRSSASGGGSMHGCRVSALAAALAAAAASSDSPPASTTTTDPRARRDAVEQVLETVHARLVADFDRLASVTEAVEGVEVLLDIELDVFRNAYFKLGVLVNACSMGAIAVFGVTGYLAMNLGGPNSGEDIEGKPKWEKEWPMHSFGAFVAAALGSAALFMLGSVGLVAWMQWRGMAPLGLSSFGRQPQRGGAKGVRRR